jgi:hypothetical protein
MTKAEMLAQARVAYHQLHTGGMPRVVVDQNGSRVEYAAANKQNLYGYIQALEAELGCATGIPSGPARFIF